MKHLKHYAGVLTILMLLPLITITSCSDDEEGLMQNQPPFQKHHAILYLKTMKTRFGMSAQIDSALARPDVDSVIIMAEHHKTGLHFTEMQLRFSFTTN